MDKKTLEEIRPGALNREQILKLKGDLIPGLNEDDVDASAFDLHLSQQGWIMKGSIKGSGDKTIMEVIQRYQECPFSIEKPQKLEAQKTYVFQLKECLNLPPNYQFYGRATGKSSIGRLDVLARLMVDRCPSYDEIDPKHDSYPGSLFLEITPITFDIQVQEGVALSQLRIFRGRPELSELRPDQLELFGEMILDEHQEPKAKQQVCDLRVDLRPDQSCVSAFKAKKNNNLVVNLMAKSRSHNPKDFWEEIRLEQDFALETEPERFYILRSKERFKLPLDVAVYCEAVSETLGELRIHYAGFVHPGFGFDRKGGTPVIFEVRGHNVKTFLRDGETLAHIKFYRMSESCKEATKSGYEEQELKLSKYFEDWA
jgi:dCTP deaminase